MMFSTISTNALMRKYGPYPRIWIFGLTAKDCSMEVSVCRTRRPLLSLPSPNSDSAGFENSVDGFER
jgi:hypothetical protein